MANQIVKRSPSEELAAIFDDRAQAIAKALPPNCGLTPARFAQFAIQAYKTDQLRECTPMSMYEASLECATLGLIIGGPLAHGYLVSYNCKVKENGVERWEKRAQFQLGYRGMVELLRRSGAVTQCEVRAVFDGDEFDYSFGLNPRLDHKPLVEPSPDTLTHAYAIARFKDGTAQFDVMTRGEILSIMARSKSRNKETGDMIGPWATDPIEMAKKCPVRRVAKVLPMSQELNDALARDDERTIDVSARVEIPKTFAPPRHAARITTTEAPPDGNESTGDSGDAPPEEQPPQRTPIDDFVARMDKAETMDALAKIGKECADVGCKNDVTNNAWIRNSARIKGAAK